jgi:ERCC4-type nuclease
MSSNPSWAILLDDEHREGALAQICQKLNVPYTTEMLHIGDAQISQRICYEVKRITATNNDLWASVKDDRCFYQSGDRHTNFEVNILIIQCAPGTTPWTNWDAGPKKPNYNPELACKHLLQDLELTFDVHIRYTSSDEETMISIIEDWQRLVNRGLKELAPINKTPRPKKLFQQQQYWVSGFLDCGADTSYKLLTFFRKPINIVKFFALTEVKKTDSGKGYKKITVDRPKGIGPELIKANHELLLNEDPELPPYLKEEESD